MTRPIGRVARLRGCGRSGGGGGGEDRAGGLPLPVPDVTRERSPLQKAGWFANFLLRTFVLSKLLPRLFSPAAIVLVQRPQLSYAQVWRTAQRTTRRLQGLGLAAALAAAWPWLRRLALPLPPLPLLLLPLAAL